jgi:Kef-type K+ transport system membrane component KefB
MEPVQLAVVLAAVILVASVVSVEIGITVALFELGLGIFLGNTFDLGSHEWLDFLAAHGARGCGEGPRRAHLGLLTILVGAKMIPKLGLVYPLARRYAPRHAAFAALLMSTGLTFGTISALFGLNAGIIDRTQFSLLVTVVVFSAIIPTAIAERWRS